MRLNSIMVAACVAALAGTAHAGTYDFSYSSVSGPMESGSGVFTTGSVETSGYFDVLSITGTAETSDGATSAITGLSSYASSDNRYYPVAPAVDFSGLSFALASGVAVNLYSDDGAYLATDTIFDPTGDSPVSGDAVIDLTITAVPEPGAWMLMLAGFAGLGLALRRRRPALSA
jgi:hypothetical protein